MDNHLFFFDIPGHRLHAVSADGAHESWELGCFGSAAAKLGDGRLLIATETALQTFDPATGAREDVVPLEADMPANRSNDGRADRQGGFWIGTMGKNAEPQAGAIYRYYRGELRLLFPRIGISNAISFAPDGRRAYFTDTQKREVYTIALDHDGWPVGEPTVFYRPTDGGPDGAVVDAEGGMVLALWGGSKAIRIAPTGEVTHEIAIPAAQVTCPAFGPDGRLYVTTARHGLDASALASQPHAGGIFVSDAPAPGIDEPVVQL